MTFQARNEIGNKLTEAVTRGGGEARRLVNEVLPSIDTKVLAAKVEAPTLSQVFEVKAAAAEPERREQRKNPAVYQKGEGWLRFLAWLPLRLPVWIARTILVLGAGVIGSIVLPSLVIGLFGTAAFAAIGGIAWAFHGFALSYISIPFIVKSILGFYAAGAVIGGGMLFMGGPLYEGKEVEEFITRDKIIG